MLPGGAWDGMLNLFWRVSRAFDVTRDGGVWSAPQLPVPHPPLHHAPSEVLLDPRLDVLHLEVLGRRRGFQHQVDVKPVAVFGAQVVCGAEVEHVFS